MIRIERIDGRERRHRHFARSHRWDQSEGDVAVEADRLQHDVEPIGDPSGDRIIDLADAAVLRRLGEAEQNPQDHGRCEDDGARALQEDDGALPQSQQYILRARPLIFGHFHQEAATRALGDGGAQDQRDQHRPDDPGDVEAEEHESLEADAQPHVARRDEGADDHRIDGKARRAGHEGRDQYGGQPVFRIGDGARRHDSRNGAGEGGKQRDEGAARQADAGHQPVHQEGGAHHIAGRFQHQDEEEEDEDLRQENNDRPHAVDDPVHQEGS